MRILLLFFSVLMYVKGVTQVREEGLQRGDELPASALPAVLSDAGSGATGPSLILFDFWSVNCISCIQSFSKLDSLQQQFGEKIRIVLVTKNTAEQVNGLFARRNQIRRPGLLMINGDTVLSKLFPYKSVPHYAWIDGSRRVRHITSGNSITAGSIQAELDGKKQQLYEKKDVQAAESRLPFDGTDERLLYYSYLMKRIRGLSGASTRYYIKDSVTGKVQGLHISSSPIIGLYKIAYGRDLEGGLFMYNNRVELRVKNAADYLRPGDPVLWDEWEDAHCYRYTLKAPIKETRELFTVMQKELENLFGLRGMIERRRAACLVLKRAGTGDLFASKGGKKRTVYEKNEPLLLLQNLPLSVLVNRIAFENQQLPVVDETGFTGMADLILYARADDKVNLGKELGKYGLQLTKEMRELEILVLTDDHQ